jgi:GT2 family glycosyltransferase
VAGGLRSSAPAVPESGGIALVAPAAVRIVDLETPLVDLQLPVNELGEPYRSLMVVARLDGQPLGTASLDVAEGGVSRSHLAVALQSQLEAELGKAFARRGLAVPALLPPEGIPARRDGGRAQPARRSVSVVVTTCGYTAAFERCLRSILASRYGDFEVIVVDNRPGAGFTRAMLSERFDDARLKLVEEPRQGLSSARNAGLAAANGDLVAFTDDDVVVDSDWVGRSVEAFERAPDVACVTGLILPFRLESDSQLILEQFAAFSKGFDPRTLRLPDARDEYPLLPYTPGVIGSGANTMLRADVARRLGGFDADLGTGTVAAGGEDLDLYVRLLRGGHAVAYEPSAIVWHEHPDGSSRLRRQVFRYGVGLGAALAKQLFAGPGRRDLLRSVPAGIRYLREPTSRKNAGKAAEYPRRLNWLERLGMLLGPAAYLASVGTQRIRRVAGEARGGGAGAPAKHVERVALSGGRSVEVVSFLDLDLVPRPAEEDRPAARTTSSRALMATTGFTCLAAPLAVAAGMPAVLCLVLVLAFVCLAPGIALVTLLRGRAEAGLVLGLGLGATAVLAQSMVWLGAWWPETLLYALAAVVLPVPVSQLLRGRSPGSMRAGVSSGAAEAWDALRYAAHNTPRAGALHALNLAAALAAWALSLGHAEVGQIGGIGLLSAMPPGWFLALLLLVGGFAMALRGSPAAPKLLGLYVVALIVVVHGTTPLLYDQPRYTWTYNHLGVIGLIAENGAVDRGIDIYNNWPAFFAANAWLTALTGLSPRAYAPAAQLFFSLASVAALRFALRGITSDERLLWTAAWFFVLANWVGQDYLAPQAFSFVLSLLVLGLCLRCGSPPRASLGEAQPAPPPLSPRAAVVAGGLLYLAIVTSHQLSPVVLLIGVLALAVLGRRVPLWVPAAMAAVEMWWVALAWPYLSDHYDLFDFNPGANRAPAGYELGDGLPGSELVAYSSRLAVVLVIALAAIGFVRRFRAGHRDLATAALALTPLAVVFAQSYGGEARFRIYLFALPWLCFFAAAAFLPLPRARSHGLWRSWRVALASTALGACLLFAYFGLELMNRVTDEDVKAAVWFERHAPPNSRLVGVTPSFPRRLTAEYAGVHDPDYPGALSLTEDGEGFRNRRLGAADLPRLEQTLRGVGPERTYMILTPSQQRFGRLYGVLPPGSMRGLERALTSSRSFRPVYRRGGAAIFEYRPGPGRTTAP